MALFSFFNDSSLHLAPDTKIIKSADFSSLIDAHRVIEEIKKQAAEYRVEVARECELLKQEAAKEGFAEGLATWNEQISFLEKEIAHVKQEMENSLVPLALTAIKKVLGRELEMKKETFVDIIATSLKSVSHHRKIKIYVNKNNLELVEKHRSTLKAVFDHLESLTLSPRDDVALDECIVETEAGIIKVSLESQLQSLEKAFHLFFHPQPDSQSRREEKK